MIIRIGDKIYESTHRADGRSEIRRLRGEDQSIDVTEGTLTFKRLFRAAEEGKLEIIK